MGGAVSSGENNDDLIDKLVDRRCIVSRRVERLFRAVDRGHFVTSDSGEGAYQDTAWRERRLHLSAPCIYTAVLESLALRPGHRFLNIGSGTGYISTLAGLAVGSGGVNHGVELFTDVVDYARQRVDAFIRDSPSVDRFDFGRPLFVAGNVLRLEALQCSGDGDEDGCTGQRYDRVYCGAGCDTQQMELLRQLLVVGGVLVAPVNDSLMRVQRLSQHRWRSEEKLSVSFAPLRTSVDAADSEDSEDIAVAASMTPGRTELVRLPMFAPASLLQLCRSAVRETLRRCVVAGMSESGECEQGAAKVSGRRRRRRRRSASARRHRQMLQLLVGRGDQQLTVNMNHQSIMDRFLWGAVVSVAENVLSSDDEVVTVGDGRSAVQQLGDESDDHLSADDTAVESEPCTGGSEGAQRSIGSDIVGERLAITEASCVQASGCDVTSAVGAGCAVSPSVATPVGNRLGVKRSADGSTVSHTSPSTDVVPINVERPTRSPTPVPDEEHGGTSRHDDTDGGSSSGSSTPRRVRRARNAHDSDLSGSTGEDEAQEKPAVVESRDTMLAREISRRMCSRVAALPLPVSMRVYVNLDRPLVGI